MFTKEKEWKVKLFSPFSLSTKTTTTFWHQTRSIKSFHFWNKRYSYSIFSKKSVVIILSLGFEHFKVNKFIAISFAINLFIIEIQFGQCHVKETVTGIAIKNESIYNSSCIRTTTKKHLKQIISRLQWRLENFFLQNGLIASRIRVGVRKQKNTKMERTFPQAKHSN